MSKNSTLNLDELTLKQTYAMALIFAEILRHSWYAGASHEVMKKQTDFKEANKALTPMRGMVARMNRYPTHPYEYFGFLNLVLDQNKLQFEDEVGNLEYDSHLARGMKFANKSIDKGAGGDFPLMGVIGKELWQKQQFENKLKSHVKYSGVEWVEWFRQNDPDYTWSVRDLERYPSRFRSSDPESGDSAGSPVKMVPQFGPMYIAAYEEMRKIKKLNSEKSFEGTTVTALDIAKLCWALTTKPIGTGALAAAERIVAPPESDKIDTAGGTKVSKTAKDDNPQDKPPPSKPPGQQPGIEVSPNAIHLNLDNLNDCGSWEQNSLAQKALAAVITTNAATQSARLTMATMAKMKGEATLLSKLFSKLRKPGTGKRSLTKWLLQIGAAGGAGYVAHASGAEDAAAGIVGGSIGLFNPVTAVMVVGAGLYLDETEITCVLDKILLGAIIGTGAVATPEAVRSLTRSGKALFNKVEKAKAEKIPFVIGDETAELIGLNRTELALRVQQDIATDINKIDEELRELADRQEVDFLYAADRAGAKQIKAGEAETAYRVAKDAVKGAQANYNRVRANARGEFDNVAQSGYDAAAAQKDLEQAKEALKKAESTRDGMRTAAAMKEGAMSIEEIINEAIKSKKLYLEYMPESGEVLWLVDDTISLQKSAARQLPVGDNAYDLAKETEDYVELAGLLNHRLRKATAEMDANRIDKMEDIVRSTKKIIDEVQAAAEEGKDITIKPLLKVIGKLAKETLDNSAGGKELVASVDRYLEARKAFNEALGAGDENLKASTDIFNALKDKLRLHMSGGDLVAKDILDHLRNPAAETNKAIRKIGDNIRRRFDDLGAGASEITKRTKILEAFEACHKAEAEVLLKLEELEVVFQSRSRQLQEWVKAAVATKGKAAYTTADRYFDTQGAYPTEFREAVAKAFAKKLRYRVGRGVDPEDAAEAGLAGGQLVRDPNWYEKSRMLRDLFNPENKPMKVGAAAAKVSGYLAPSVSLYYYKDSISDNVDSSALSSEFKKKWNTLNSAQKLLLVKSSFTALYNTLQFSLKNAQREVKVKEIFKATKETKEDQNIWPLIIWLTERPGAGAGIIRAYDQIRPSTGESDEAMGWFEKDKSWVPVLPLVYAGPVIKSKRLHADTKFNDHFSGAPVGEMDEVAFHGNDSFFTKLVTFIKEKREVILGAIAIDGTVKENKRRPKVMQKSEIYNLIKEAFQDNVYGKYPYSHKAGQEEDDPQDYQQDWDSMSLEILEDRSRDRAIQFAKILVKEFELLTFVLDAVGKDQSLGAEILRKMEESPNNQNKMA
jgi:hypothetical protein